MQRRIPVASPIKKKKEKKAQPLKVYSYTYQRNINSSRIK